MPSQSVHIVVSGKVQGVGFRYFAVRKAEELQITGWVRNNHDGKVEIEAEGNPDQLSAFVDWLRLGPPRAVVTGVSVQAFSPPRGFAAFSVR